MSRINRLTLCITIAISVLSLLGTPVSTEAATTLNVAAPGTIQDAVAAANPGDTITVSAGTYPEYVSVNKTLTLRGAQAGVDGRSRTGSGESVVARFYVTADNVTIDGFTIQGAIGYTFSNGFGGGMELGVGTTGATVANNIIQNNSAGLLLANRPTGNQCLIQHNLFRNNNQEGTGQGHHILSDQYIGSGGVANVLIDGNDFIVDSGIASFDRGIGLEGLVVGDHYTNITVKNNNLSSNSGDSRGMYFYSMHSSSITDNIIINNRQDHEGLGFFGDDFDITVTGNTIQNNVGRAIWIGLHTNMLPDQSYPINSQIVLHYNNLVAPLGLYMEPCPSDYCSVSLKGYSGTLNAEYNWWGSLTGPSIDTNPGGTGDIIYDPDRQVSYKPFLTSQGPPWTSEPITGTCLPISSIKLVQGVAINVPVTNTCGGAGGPYKFSATGLPPGLSIDGDTGTIRGTPTAVGTFNFTVTITDIAGNTASFSYSITVSPPSQDLCPPAGTTGFPSPVGTLFTNVDTNGNVYARYEQVRTLNDNSYGTTAVGWPGSHKFGDLTGSDKVQFIFTDKNGKVVFDFYLDYLSAKSGTPSGYASLGVLGGEGKVNIGKTAWLTSWNTSMAKNLNNFGYCSNGNCSVKGTTLLVNSPPTISSGPTGSYTLPAGSPYSKWDFTNSYEVTISNAAFGSVGFGGVTIGMVHNSPSKVGVNSVDPVPCRSGVCAAQPATGSIKADFNSTKINAGSTIWFNSNLKVSGLDTSRATTITFTNSQVLFNGQPYPVPDATIVFDPNAPCASTTYDDGWFTTVPTSGSDEIFLSGLTLPVPAGGYPGGVKGVTWSGDFRTYGATVSISWKWSAAVYTRFSSDYNALRVKPAHNNTCTINNSDYAGTPEAFKYYVSGGARGGGIPNYTGSWSGTQSLILSCNISGTDPAACSGSIGDLVWKDQDGDGIQDAGEPGMSGIVLMLKQASLLKATTTTDPLGGYSFDNLCKGDYTVEVSAPLGYQLTNSGADSKQSPAAVTLATDFTPDNSIDFGMVAPLGALIKTGVAYDRNKINITLKNTGKSATTLGAFQFTSWPAANGKLQKVLIGPQVVWDGGDIAAPGPATLTGLKNNTINPGTTLVLTVQFEKNVSQSAADYELDLLYSSYTLPIFP